MLTHLTYSLFERNSTINTVAPQNQHYADGVRDTMSKSPLSPFWTRNTGIPIYLDTVDEREHTCHTCGTSAIHQPIHCITVASAAPPPYRAEVTPPSSSYRTKPLPAPPSAKLEVPALDPETSRRWSRPRPPRPALRFDFQSDAEGRLRVRSRKSSFSPISPGTIVKDIFGRQSYSSGSSIPNTPVEGNEQRKSKLGLGIPDVPFRPDPSPIRSPGGQKLANAERGEALKKKATPNLAQGIEQKLWKYSASRNVVKRWLLEIVSWLLSALCMTAIIVGLIILKDHPVPTNWPLGLTVNTYIAILSRIASAALVLPASEALGQLKWSWFQGDSKKMWDFEIFDNASRGPWGSFLLLVRTKGRTLAALGAAITVFAMALDPFFQQVAHYPQRWELQTQNGSIPRVLRYEPPDNQEFNAVGDLISPNMDMKPVVDKFFLDFGVPQFPVGNGTRAEIPLTCPGSKCTWEPYETLGVCSECVDIADMLDFTCLKGTLDWVSNATSYDPYQNGTMCGWFFNSTSAKPVLMLGYQADPITNKPSGEILITRALPLVTNINRRPLFSGSINFKHVRNPLSDFVVVSAANGPDREKMLASILRREKPRAIECVLSWCVQTIHSEYNQAIYSEVVKDRFINTTEGPWPWTTLQTGIPDVVLLRYFQNITVQPRPPGNEASFSNFGAGNDTAFDIMNAFDSYLPSFFTTKTNDSDVYLKIRTFQAKPAMRRNQKNPWAAPRNITAHIERLATTLTNTMRQSSQDNYTGKSYGEETFVEVRWLWLSLPVGLLVLTLVFLVATVIRTSMELNQVGVWKNSAIATLLYGLPDEMQRKITASQTAGTPRTKAKELNVRMLPTRGWRISGNLLSPITRKSKNEPPPGWI